MSIFFPLEPGSAVFEGRPDAVMRWIADVQLKNRDAWAHFVDAFRTGIDSADHGWRGEYWGKMMRGACLAQAYLRDPELEVVLREAVEGLLSTQDAVGRISSYRADEELVGWDMWARKYVLTGLLHYLEICFDDELRERIVSALQRHADAIIERVGSRDGQVSVFRTSEHWGGVNSCSILEPMVRLHQLTHEARYLEFAKYLVEVGGCEQGSLIALAAEGKLSPFEYPETKAYETISYFEGVMAYAEAVGDESLFDTVVAFAEAVAKTDITLIGCAGCTHELFDHSAVRQTEAIDGIVQETCVTVTWMRFCDMLLRVTGNPRWADEMERAAWNALYGALNVHGEAVWSNEIREWVAGMPVDSYSPLYCGRRGRAMGGFKQYPDGFVYGCCVCIYAAGVALVNRAAVYGIESQVPFVFSEGIAINSLFQGKISTSTPREQPLLLEMESAYPLQGECTIRMSLARPEVFRMLIRVPSVAESPVITAGDETHPVATGYTIIDREWHNGDVIRVSFEMPLKEVSLQGRIAFQRGPLVLSRDARKEAQTPGVFAGALSEAVSVAHTAEGAPIVEAQLPPDASEQEMLRLTLKREDGSSLLLTDYASCGKHWRDENGLLSVWLNP